MSINRVAPIQTNTNTKSTDNTMAIIYKQKGGQICYVTKHIISVRFHLRCRHPLRWKFLVTTLDAAWAVVLSELLLVAALAVARVVLVT
jgi:hypothetical protein